MESNTGIHCKIAYNEHIRRFHFVGTEFVSLKESIARLFSLNDEFVLKYLDDEKEYVTLESQEDYLTALEITPTILRLVIVKPSGPCIVPSSPSFPCFDQGHERKRCGKHGGHHGHHGHGGHHGKNGHHGHWKKHCRFSGPDSPIPEHHHQRKEQKLIFLNHCIDALSAVEESQLSPWDLRRKQRLLKKKERITACLAGNCPRQQKSPVTDEDKQFNDVLRQQIAEVKSEIRGVKGKIRELKILRQDKQGDKGIEEQIKQLKEKKYVLKGQIRSLYCSLK
jgi:hypothetical protein